MGWHSRGGDCAAGRQVFTGHRSPRESLKDALIPVNSNNCLTPYSNIGRCIFGHVTAHHENMDDMGLDCASQNDMTCIIKKLLQVS